MTLAIAALRDGHAFQARMFWQRAAHLLDPSSPVVRVAFEKGPKGFDDIWVDYAPGRGPLGADGNLIDREHIQCKWHVATGSYGYADLVDPDFVNASAKSFLERALEAHRAAVKRNGRAQFALLTNWTIARDDPLAPLVAQRSKTLRLDDMFTGKTTRSVNGKMRQVWREHLSVDEEGLRALAGSLAFRSDATSLDEHRGWLDVLFENRGLARIPVSESSFKYDDVMYQWLGQGRIEFDKSSFRDVCAKEGLLASPRRYVAFGVKSFEHPFDRLEARCTEVLNLTTHFDSRAIQDKAAWQEKLYPKLKAFLTSVAQREQSIQLALDAHLTLAFAAGSVLDIKSGRLIELEQRTLGKHIWTADDLEPDASWGGWQFALEPGEGPDFVVAVSATHDVLADVQKFAAGSLPNATVLHARLGPGPGATAVHCGRHAFDLAQSVAQEIARTKAPQGKVHLFIAAPGSFAFYLGQRATSIGRATLYEFDFGGQNTYAPSLEIPQAT